jgi:dihydrofolate reductase
MATITASLFTALDGVVDPGVGNWHFPYFNEEMGIAVDSTHDADVMLFGRVTYDSFAGAWPQREAAGEQDAVFAKRLGDIRKIVASRSPREFTWRNSEPLQGDLVEAVTALNNDPAIRRIALSGWCVSSWTPVCSMSCICSSTPLPPGRGSSRSRTAAPRDTSS